jgi:hypothetical protein
MADPAQFQSRTMAWYNELILWGWKEVWCGVGGEKRHVEHGIRCFIGFPGTDVDRPSWSGQVTRQSLCKRTLFDIVQKWSANIKHNCQAGR